MLLLLATAPLSWLALFFSYVLRARVALGRWPEPSRPDPYELGFHVHHVVVLLGVPVSLVCAAAAVVGSLWPWRKGFSWRRRGLIVALAVFSTWFALRVSRSNPGYLFAWFMD